MYKRFLNGMYKETNKINLSRFFSLKTTGVLFMVFTIHLFLIGCGNVKNKNKEESIQFTKEKLSQITIPDVEGKNIKGVVAANGRGVEGVVVSDGYDVTTTDKDGIYYLSSNKKNGYVFISVPGNYEVANEGSLPQFFKRLRGGNTVERKDFALHPTNNTKHVVLAMADWHLANRNEDLKQFEELFIPEINETIADYAAKGVKVYGLTLGDLAWDSFWYKNNFALPEYLEYMNMIEAPVYNVMGNHDNDPYGNGDWEAALPYKNIIAPNYYSFNLGDVHYVVLDNIEYINDGAAPGQKGKGNYEGNIVKEQMEWLKKDLATIKDKSKPLVIALHIPFYDFPTLNDKGEQEQTVRLDNGDEMLALLNDFEKVHILSGHTHLNFVVDDIERGIMEHNIAAVCATWWWTGKKNFAQNHICRDGSPGGYAVWEIDGSEMEWHYKGAGVEKEYQFRAYDLNTIHFTAEEYAPKADIKEFEKYVGEYGIPNNNNEVLINVWGYDTQWRVEVEEDGNPLEVTRVEAKDPLHMISYTTFRVNAGAKPTPSFVSKDNNHMFKVVASSPTSTLHIKVTDRFGNVYTEEMERPKELTYSMK